MRHIKSKHGGIYSYKMLNSDGTYSIVAELVLQYQKQGIPRKNIDMWLMGLERGLRLTPEQRKGI